MEKIINVELYGGKGMFGGRETPLEADLILCSAYNDCDFYKNKQCLKVRSFGTAIKCPGTVNRIKGYTSRSRKYYEFKSKYKNMECYGKLKNVELRIAKIKDNWYIKNSFLQRNKEGKIILTNSFFNSTCCMVSDEEFDCELIRKIAKYTPRTIIDNKVIESYYIKQVIPFLRSLKNNFPDKFEELINAYPEFDKSYTNVGRKAKVKSIRNGVVIKHNKDSFEVMNGFLINRSNSNTMFIKIFDVYASKLETEIKIKITDDMVVEITDEDQVDEKTVFVE